MKTLYKDRQMHSLVELQKQQIGLRLPKYLVDEIDALTKKYNLNRTDIIIESIRSYIQNQKEQEFYDDFDKSCKELKELLKDPKNAKSLKSLDEVLDEL